MHREIFVYHQNPTKIRANSSHLTIPDSTEEYIKYSSSLKLEDESREHDVALLSSRFRSQCQGPVTLSMKSCCQEQDFYIPPGRPASKARC